MTLPVPAQGCGRRITRESSQNIGRRSIRLGLVLTLPIYQRSRDLLFVCNPSLCYTLSQGIPAILYICIMAVVMPRCVDMLTLMGVIIFMHMLGFLILAHCST